MSAMSMLPWRIFAFGFSAYVISLTVSPWDFSDIKWLALRVVTSIIWIMTAVGLALYAFNASKGSSGFWVAIKYGWAALGCLLFFYGWATTDRAISSASFIFANVMMGLVVVANFVALDRLSIR
jgi:hypothetical protein